MFTVESNFCLKAIAPSTITVYPEGYLFIELLDIKIFLSQIGSLIFIVYFPAHSIHYDLSAAPTILMK